MDLTTDQSKATGVVINSFTTLDMRQLNCIELNLQNFVTQLYKSNLKIIHCTYCIGYTCTQVFTVILKGLPGRFLIF